MPRIYRPRIYQKMKMIAYRERAGITRRDTPLNFSRARFLRTVNLMRRRADGSWHGDMVDGLGFVAAARIDPRGMRAAYCGCVITKPEISPFIAAARALGCATATGTDMYQQHQSIMVDFLLGIDGGR